MSDEPGARVTPHGCGLESKPKRIRKPSAEIVVKRAIAAGLKVTSYTVGDITVRLEEPQSAGATLTALQEWRAKKNARSA